MNLINALNIHIHTHYTYLNSNNNKKVFHMKNVLNLNKYFNGIQKSVQTNNNNNQYIERKMI